MTYTDLTLIAAGVVFIVDVSGFTDTWLGWLSRWLGTKVTKLRPFSCSLCMVFWTCLVCTLATGTFSPATFAYTCLLACLSYPMAQAFIFIREGLLALINKLMAKL